VFIATVRFLLDPFSILWILILITAILWLLKNERWFRYSFFTLLGWLLISSTPLIPGAALESLEERYEPIRIENLADIDADYHIVVLGGGHGFDDRLPPNSLLSAQALARLNEGIRLHRQLPNSRLLLSGYSSSGRTSQAEMLQQTAILLGVDEGNTLLQKEPANTWQEARVYSERYGNSHPVILVTSASHMPRAVGAFERFGVEPAPSPTHYRIKKDFRKRRSLRSWMPSQRNMEHLRVAHYEYAALFRDNLR